MDMITNEGHSKHADCAWPDDPCNQLTFVEAMALDPSEVEVEHRGEWVPLERPHSPSGEFLLSFLRKAKLRRQARPKKTRVQEWAEGLFVGEHDTNIIGTAYVYAIRKVCIEVRSWGGETFQSVARDIESHFLEPR